MERAVQDRRDFLTAAGSVAAIEGLSSGAQAAVATLGPAVIAA